MLTGNEMVDKEWRYDPIKGWGYYPKPTNEERWRKEAYDALSKLRFERVIIPDEEKFIKEYIERRREDQEFPGM